MRAILVRWIRENWRRPEISRDIIDSLMPALSAMSCCFIPVTAMATARRRPAGTGLSASFKASFVTRCNLQNNDCAVKNFRYVSQIV